MHPLPEHTTRLTGFEEIFGKAKGDTVDLIRLPQLETIDRPYRKDEARLEDALSESLMRIMAAARKEPDVNDPQAEIIASKFTWSSIFEQISAVYRQVLDQGIASAPQA